MTTVLISLHPRHSKNILAGKKIIELRKRFPDYAKQVVFYETVPTKAIVGIFSVKSVYHRLPEFFIDECQQKLQLTRDEISKYLNGRDGIGIEVNQVHSLRRTISLEKMKSVGINPPQSYRFLSNKNLEQLGISHEIN